jgi:glycosyltransferase involved in cell wall biosynthesis
MRVKVSICIPAYNQTEYLRKNLDSILMQSFVDYEVILTDDSTTNEVRDLVDEYDFKGKLKYYHNGAALGSPANWNRCISKAKGDYIKIMHHDDWFSSCTSLAQLVALFESGNNSIAFCGCNNISRDGSNLFTHFMTGHEAGIVKACPEFLFYNNRIGSPSVTLFKKNSHSFDENIKYLVDSEYYIQLLKANPRFAYTTDALVNIGHHENQVTHTVVDDRDVMMYEYLYTYQKLHHDKNSFKWYFDTFWRLIKSFHIKSVSQLDHYAGLGKIPGFLFVITKATRFMSKTRMYKLERPIKYLTYQYARQFGHY